MLLIKFKFIYIVTWGVTNQDMLLLATLRYLHIVDETILNWKSFLPKGGRGAFICLSKCNAIHEKRMIQKLFSHCIQRFALHQKPLVEQCKIKIYRKLNLIWKITKYVKEIDWNSLPIYVFTLDFCNSLVWSIKFDDLDFCHSLNRIFLPAVACKIQVWNRPKIKFTKLDISR